MAAVRSAASHQRGSSAPPSIITTAAAVTVTVTETALERNCRWPKNWVYCSFGCSRDSCDCDCDTATPHDALNTAMLSMRPISSQRIVMRLPCVRRPSPRDSLGLLTVLHLQPLAQHRTLFGLSDQQELQSVWSASRPASILPLPPMPYVPPGQRLCFRCIQAGQRSVCSCSR